MRGKALACAEQRRRPGITPAYAGKRVSIPLRSCGHRDHPRVCGEKRRTCRAWRCVLGSPPRMRGKVAAQHDGVEDLRITPAYAGKRLRCGRGCGSLLDHPRVCGEKAMSVAGAAVFKGSPPRMRGKGKCSDIKKHGQRITPAYAGKRFYEGLGIMPEEDHPRVCGEKK